MERQIHQQVVAIWRQEMGSTGKGGMAPSRIVQALLPLITEHGLEPVLRNWRGYLRRREAPFATPEDFASRYKAWAGGRPTNTADSRKETDRRAFMASMQGGRLGGTK